MSSKNIERLKQNGVVDIITPDDNVDDELTEHINDWLEENKHRITKEIHNKRSNKDSICLPEEEIVLFTIEKFTEDWLEENKDQIIKDTREALFKNKEKNKNE